MSLPSWIWYHRIRVRRSRCPPKRPLPHSPSPPSSRREEDSSLAAQAGRPVLKSCMAGPGSGAPGDSEPESQSDRRSRSVTVTARAGGLVVTSGACRATGMGFMAEAAEPWVCAIQKQLQWKEELNLSLTWKPRPCGAAAADSNCSLRVFQRPSKWLETKTTLKAVKELMAFFLSRSTRMPVSRYGDRRCRATRAQVPRSAIRDRQNMDHVFLAFHVLSHHMTHKRLFCQICWNIASAYAVTVRVTWIRRNLWPNLKKWRDLQKTWSLRQNDIFSQLARRGRHGVLAIQAA